MAFPHSFTRSLLIIFAILGVLALPFLTVESRVQDWWKLWSSQTIDARLFGTGVVAVLAADIVLPIPSSLVGTLAGARLGTVAGTCVTWLGLTLGAMAGFCVARWGASCAPRLLTEPAETAGLAAWRERWGAALLVASRALPLFAEATVIWVGIQRMSWSQFLPPIIFSNLGLAIAYAALGDIANEHQWLPAALAISVALPLLLTLGARRMLTNPNDLVDTGSTQ